MTTDNRHSQFIAELEWRGLIQQVSSPKLTEAMEKPIGLYAGFDPTSDSLHVGHLLPLITLKRAKEAGHNVIALIGGATALIGDPSGKSTERNLINREVVRTNTEAIEKQIRFIMPSAVICNNIEWFDDFNVISFLRDVGKHFSVNAMLNRDAVKSRLETEQGLSFTEFSYILLQAYDFSYLNAYVGCELQIGGSDQWGNIVSGIDLIRRRDREAFGLTLPLLTNSNGEKFGKTVKGAVWLDPNKTSPQDLFQFFFNTPDADVVRLLKFFTFLNQQEIRALEEQVKAAPEKRAAQKALATSVCQLVHGVSGTEPSVVFVNPGTKLIDVLVRSELCSSKTDARNQIEQGGIKLDSQVIRDVDTVLDVKDLAPSPVLSRGKKHQRQLKL